MPRIKLTAMQKLTKFAAKRKTPITVLELTRATHLNPNTLRRIISNTPVTSTKRKCKVSGHKVFTYDMTRFNTLSANAI